MKSTRVFFIFAVLTAAVAQAGQEGWAEAANCATISGWAWDTTQPVTPIFVDIYDGATSVASVRADIFRQDLLNAGRGNGYHGFSFPTPASLKDNQWHNLRIYFSGTTTLLGYGAQFAVNCAPGSTGYLPYFMDALTSVNAANWNQNGSLTAAASGLTAASAAGGSLISKVAVPDGTNDYEVSANITLAQSGGTYTTYLRASQDALAGPSTQGSFYAAELTEPVLQNGGCTSALWLYKRVNGVVSVVSYNNVVCRPVTNIRMMKTSADWVYVFVDRTLAIAVPGLDLPTGKGGVGVRNAPAANSISRVELGPQDRIAPSTIPANRISVSALPTRVDFHWQGAADDSNGTGVVDYIMLRDGNYLGTGNFNSFTDLTAQPNTSYTYTLYVADFHSNYVTQNISVRTPAAGAGDPRKVGVRTTGTYWGGNGENIDMLSGNLTFSLPLLQAKARSGWSVPVSLVYNSQNWRKLVDSWNLGTDTGFGYGWKLMAGSLTPVWGSVYSYQSLTGFVFTDNTGAEYRLETNTSGVWTSSERPDISYDTASRRLYFNDGSFWLMGCVSAGTEQDAGTMYPTVLQDSNGNQIILKYRPGVGTTWPDSSSRITQIQDVRATQIAHPGTAVEGPWTYNFSYDTDLVLPHLVSMVNSIGTSEALQVELSGLQTLTSPFTGANFDTTQYLRKITISGLPLVHQFETDSSGRLTKVTFPYGGYLRWQYGNWSYLGGIEQPEVTARYLNDGSDAGEKAYAITHPNETNDGTRTMHASSAIDDPSGIGGKTWRFDARGLLSTLERRDGSTLIASDELTWTSHAKGFLYVSRTLTKMDLSSSKQKQTEQVVDGYGNLLTTKVYDWGIGAPGALMRTYSHTYLSDANYTSRYIRNRLVTSTVTGGGQTVTLVTNDYDVAVPSCGGVAGPPSDMKEHDPAYGLYYYRGNVVRRTDPAGTTTFNYDAGGNTICAKLPSGLNVTSGFQSATNYAAPNSVTTGTLGQTLQWSPALVQSGGTGANGETSSLLFDPYGRPASSTSATGAVTTFEYANAAPWTVKATTNGRWSRKTLDGFGRTVKQESGNGATAVSIVETKYGPCACSPMGKVTQTSMPHANGVTAVWTTYQYDALGRTVRVTLPDASYKEYQYAGNLLTVYDEARKWKKYTMDGNGNLTAVEEPKPAADTMQTANYVTTYAYDVLNHLTTVNMDRGVDTNRGPTGEKVRLRDTPRRVFAEYEESGDRSSAG